MRDQLGPCFHADPRVLERAVRGELRGRGDVAVLVEARVPGVSVARPYTEVVTTYLAPE